MKHTHRAENSSSRTAKGRCNRNYPVHIIEFGVYSKYRNNILLVWLKESFISFSYVFCPNGLTIFSTQGCKDSLNVSPNEFED